MTHELKTWPEYFERVLSGEKTFELRKNDRHFNEGDTLKLREWSAVGLYTGRELTKRVTYVFRGGGTLGLEKGYVIMSVE